MSTLIPDSTRSRFLSRSVKARKKKRERTKTLGEPIDLPGIPLDVIIRDNDLWVAESAAVIRKLDIEVILRVITVVDLNSASQRQDLSCKYTRGTKAQ